MPQTETPISQIKINELTRTQFDNAPTLSETELYAVDPQFTGGKLLKTDSNGDIIESTATEADAAAGGTAIQGISLGGTSQTPDINKNVNIPLATNSYVGVCRGSTPNGVIALSGVLSTVAASDAELQAKTQAYHPVVPSHLDVAVREGLGNNSLTWTDAYKISACKTIGTVSGVQISGTDLTPDSTTNKVNIPVIGNNTLGVCKITTGNISATSDGRIYLTAPTEGQISSKSSTNALNPTNIDAIVKVGITTNTNTLTDTEKQNARNWLGAEAQATIQNLSTTDSITLADNTIYNGGEQTALTIALPATVDVSFLCEVCFSSGSTATTLTYPQSGINWVGDDVSSNVFTPVASKRYTIICSYDGSNYLFVVKGV